MAYTMECINEKEYDNMDESQAILSEKSLEQSVHTE